jgi:hypothetical protein
VRQNGKRLLILDLRCHQFFINTGHELKHCVCQIGHITILRVSIFSNLQEVIGFLPARLRRSDAVGNEGCKQWGPLSQWAENS